MGCYINPKDKSKEAFLILNGTPTLEPCEITETELPVCLVDNGLFTAAGIAYDEDEVDAFLHPDPRPKRWYRVSRELLRTVSDLASYE